MRLPIIVLRYRRRRMKLIVLCFLAHTKRWAEFTNSWATETRRQRNLMKRSTSARSRAARTNRRSKERRDSRRRRTRHSALGNRTELNRQDAKSAKTNEEAIPSLLLALLAVCSGSSVAQIMTGRVTTFTRTLGIAGITMSICGIIGKSILGTVTFTAGIESNAI